MKKIALLFVPLFLLAGINDSYAFKQGYREGMIIKQSLFNKMLSKKQIKQKCLNAWQKDSNDRYIKQNKKIFLKGCQEALSSGGF